MAKKINIRRSVIYHDYFSRLKNIAVSRHQWKGLPETCNERYLEDSLFHFGDAIFVDDPTMSFLTLRVTPCDSLNVYNEPTLYTAHGTGYNEVYHADDCVYIRNNRIAKSTASTIELFSERLAILDVTIDTNVNAQKTPILIRCDPKTKTSMEALYSKYEGDKPFIFATNGLSEKPLEVLTTGAPFLVDKLREEKRAVWNEALEFLGYNTNPSDKKKERVIVEEVRSNNEQIEVQGDTMLLCREEACEAINERFGLEVSVSIREKEEKEVREDGEIFDGVA